MITRRHFIKINSVATAGLGLGVVPAASWLGATPPVFESHRPKPADRKFTSKAVEATIQKVKADIKDPEIAWLFENCYPNTLDTTVNYSEKDGKPDTFVITGDIFAMWMRDSSAQVWPYLPLIKNDPELKNGIPGALRPQANSRLSYHYAKLLHESPHLDHRLAHDVAEARHAQRRQVDEQLGRRARRELRQRGPE